ncbi:MAG: DNA polymerase ligase N-terminal domain-containing protein [Vicinamibacterales bacterium]
MALEEYKRKRDFTRSPEPAGTRARTSPDGREARFFCVQKHLASHLHYDLRLEHNGVLLSWAVPKGPSLDPSIKRLAMLVEDHPVEYGEFEGVIPTGYGAGIVMLWDRGTWAPEVEDIDAALKKGDLKFTLDGYKLKGSWVLVRTKGGWSAGGADRSWLLIKHRDEWAGAVDITAFAPLSIKSEGDFADILSEDDPDVWRSNRPAKGGEAGAMFDKIIARAMEMRADRSETVRGAGPAPSDALTVRRAGSAKRTRLVRGAGAAPFDPSTGSGSPRAAPRGDKLRAPRASRGAKQTRQGAKRTRRRKTR